MRFFTFSPVAAQSAGGDIASSAIDMSQIFRMSAQIVIPSGTATGTLKLQVSNDAVKADNLFSNQVFTNWSDLGSSVSITTNGITLVAQQELCYRAMRVIYTNSFLQVATVVAVPDVAGSLQSKYFYASSKTANYYFWINVSGGGTDPVIAGKTGIEVDIATNDTAATIGAAIRAAAAGKGWTVTGATATAILTDSVGGAVPLASDAGATGFTITNTVPTGSVSVNLMSFGY